MDSREESARIKANPIRLTLLVFPDCPGRAATRKAITAAARLLGKPLELREELILSQEDTLGRDFHGSPTILLDDRDLDNDRAGQPPVFGCRLYFGRIAPDTEWIIERLKSAEFAQ